jgi:hypothetical protein
MASCFSAGVASPWVRRPPQNFSSFKALRRHRLSSLGLKTPAKLHFLFFYLLLRFVSASHFVSVLLSFIDPSSSLRHLLYRGILSPHFYASVLLAIRFSSYPLSSVFWPLISIVFSSSSSAIYPTSFRLFLRHFSVSAFVFRLLALSIPVLFSVISLSSSYLPFVFYSFVLWDTLSSVPASVSLMSPTFVSFGFSSLCRFLVVFLVLTRRLSRRLSPHIPDSFRLFLRYSLYSSSPVSFVLRLSSLRCLFSSSMVQPTSPLLIFNLGFRLFSPIDYLGSTRPPRFLHLRSYALSVLFLPFILPPRLLLRHPFSTVLVSRLLSAWGSCGVPHCRLDSWPFCTSPPPIVFATFRAPSPFPVNRLPFVFVSVFVYVSAVSPLSFQFFTRSL